MKQFSEDIVRVGGEIHQEVRRICVGKFSRHGAKAQRRKEDFFAPLREKRIAIPIRSLINLPQATEIYLSVTAFVAKPPKLLRTVILFGFVGHDNCPLKRPSPLLFIVPIKAFVAVT
jgi:hypothetical protein